MKPAAKAYRLGGQYEKADQKQNFTDLMKIEKQINLLCDQNPEMWLDPFIVRGRNFLRSLRGQDQTICLN